MQWSGLLSLASTVEPADFRGGEGAVALDLSAAGWGCGEVLLERRTEVAVVWNVLASGRPNRDLRAAPPKAR